MRTRLWVFWLPDLSIVEGLTFSLISELLIMRNFDLSPLYRSAIGLTVCLTT